MVGQSDAAPPQSKDEPRGEEAPLVGRSPSNKFGRGPRGLRLEGEEEEGAHIGRTSSVKHSRTTRLSTLEEEELPVIRSPSGRKSHKGRTPRERYKARQSLGMIQVFSHDCLRKNAFFASRSDGFLEEISDLLRVEVYHAGDTIMEEGTLGDQMFFLHTGSVEVLHKTETGNERVAVLEDGSVFGEMAMFLDGAMHQRTATVKAIDFCDCRVIQHKAFRLVLKHFPEDRKYFERLAQERQAALLEVHAEPHSSEEAQEAPAHGSSEEGTSSLYKRAMMFWRSTTGPLLEDDEEDEEEQQGEKWQHEDGKPARARAAFPPSSPMEEATADPRRNAAAGRLLSPVAEDAATTTGATLTVLEVLPADAPEEPAPSAEAVAPAGGPADARQPPNSPSAHKKRATVAGPDIPEQPGNHHHTTEQLALLHGRQSSKSITGLPAQATLPPLLVGRHGERTPQQRREAAPPSIPPPICRLHDLSMERQQCYLQQLEQLQQNQILQTAKLMDTARSDEDPRGKASEASPHKLHGFPKNLGRVSSKRSSRQSHGATGNEEPSGVLPSLPLSKPAGFEVRC